MAFVRVVSSLYKLSLSSLPHSPSRVCVSTLSIDAARSLLKSCDADSRGDVSLTFHNEHVAVVKLCNPGAANAVSCRMMLQLEEVVSELEQWSVGRAVVVLGTGKTFCSGADLGSQDVMFTEPLGCAMSLVMSDATDRLRALPIISVAAIAGAAVGGGAELATACDYRVVTEDSFMQWVHISRGVAPLWGGLRRLHGIVGRSHALFIAGTGRRLSAAQAASFGLADMILPADKNDGVVLDDSEREGLLLQGALDFMEPFLVDVAGAPLPIDPIRRLKRVLHMIDTESDANAELDFLELWGGPAHTTFMNSWAASKQKKN